MIKRTTYEFTFDVADEMQRAEITAFYCLMRDLTEHECGAEFKWRDGAIDISITTVDCP